MTIPFVKMAEAPILSFIDSVEPSHAGGVPKDIFFLTADAFGVLPPVSRLSRDQALFYFVLTPQRLREQKLE